MSSKFSAALRPNIQTAPETPQPLGRPDIEGSKSLNSQGSRALKTHKPKALKLAKSVDDEYMSTTIYVHRERYADVRAALVRDRMDFSELVDSLIINWLKTKKKA